MFRSIHSARQGRARTSITRVGSLVVPGYTRRLHWYHKQIAEALEGLLRFVRFKGERGGYARVVISMPPRLGKSLHATELLPALALGQDPDLKIMAATNGATLAKDGVNNTRQWMAHDAYQETFSTRVGSVESFDSEGRRSVVGTTDTALMFRTLRPKHKGAKEYVQAKGYYLAQGIEGSLTGRGFDIGLMDDWFKNSAEAQSPARHAKLWGLYASTFDTRGNHEHAGQLYIGTRWTEPDFIDELIEHWMNQSSDDCPLPIKVLRFSALAEEPLESYDPRQVGEGLDKDPSEGGVQSTAAFEGLRTALLAREPWVWHGLYQQRPRALGAKFFQAEDWVPYREFDMGSVIDYVDFSVDTNLSETGQSYASIIVTGVISHLRSVDGSPYFFVFEESRGHYSLNQIEDELIRLGAKWKTALPRQFDQGTWWVENKALGPTIINKYRGRFPIVAVGKVKAKLYCYRVASSLTGQQRVRVPAETWGRDPTNPALPLISHEWVGSATKQGSWVHELGNYPGKPDDRRDTLAMQVICRCPWFGPELLGRQ